MVHDGVVGLVLAAGAGRRMGGPKGLLRSAPSGPTLVETAVARLHEAGVGEVLVVVGASAPAVASLAEKAGARVVEAPDWDEGMGASLRHGLEALAGTGAQAALVMLVDLPDVGSAAHVRVLEVARASAASAADGGLGSLLVRAAYDGRPGHPVLLGREHWDAIREGAVGDRGARGHLDAASTLLVECGDLATGRDVDRPADL